MIQKFITGALSTFVMVFLLTSNCFAADLTIIQGSSDRILSDKEFQNLLDLKKIEIDDPVYHKRKHYACYRLSDILRLAGMQPELEDILIFSAEDGYQARLSIEDEINSKATAFIAVQDLDAADRWEKINQGKESVSPGPFYLVWQVPSDSPGDIKLPWPYQITTITIQAKDKSQEKLFPSSMDRTDTVKRGFKIFHQDCVACHSINLEGGVLGPELNVPKNILEYRDRKTLKEFISDPSSFRAKSKMPSFDKILPDQSIEDVLNYLAWMGKHKILNP